MEDRPSPQPNHFVISRRHRYRAETPRPVGRCRNCYPRITSRCGRSGVSGLQKKLDEVAPDVCRLAWGHKYVSLLFPDKLDDFHAEYFQRHNLIKLLQLPPAQPGLYVSAGRFVSFANQMGWPMNHLTACAQRAEWQAHEILADRHQIGRRGRRSRCMARHERPAATRPLVGRSWGIYPACSPPTM